MPITSTAVETMETESRPYDSTQELRAMILAALPYPPLPVMLRRFEDGNRLGSDVLQTSHDILSNLLTEACAKYTVRENKERQLRQQSVLREFLAEIVKDGLQAPPQLYNTLCKYTQLHIATYLCEGIAIPEVRLMPFEHVCKGDYVHGRMCDYIAAQARILELQGGLCADDWRSSEYFQMLLVARDRLVCEGRDEREIKEDELQFECEND
jgi:hypothetical protein